MTSTLSDEKLDRLNAESVLNVLGPNGPLATSIKGFEARREQQDMMSNVLEAFNRSQIALIEAGTGTGKSLAYLIPAILWAVQTKERTVISTNTITLQEQLLHKDIPLIIKTLNINIKAVLVKGMQNYLCLRKFHEAQQEVLLLSPQEATELQKIDEWKEKTQDGSRSSLAFFPSPTIWEKVCAESDTCNRNGCPYFQECHFFKARRQATEAQILVVNHHLLFADIVHRTENEATNILPTYHRLVLDEAHNIEDIATEYFASQISQMDILRLSARLASEKGEKIQGKLPLLKEKLISLYKKDPSSKISSLNSRLTIDLPGLRRDLLTQTVDTFNAFSEFAQTIHSPEKSPDDSSSIESKLRLLPYHQSHPLWEKRLVPNAKQLIGSIQRYAQALSSLEPDFKQLNNPQLDEQTKGILFEIGALATRFCETALTLEKFIAVMDTPAKVRWIEQQPLKTMINTSLVNANLDISKLLVDFLFSRIPTIVMCSATLTTNQHFQFIRSRLGLTDEHLKQRAIKEYVYDSPFNYAKQVLLAIPSDLPDPNAPAFIKEASEKIWQTLLSSRGNAFVLFTSYSMLKNCYEILEKRMRDHSLYPLKQGDDDRRTLLKKFTAQDRSVLFGTDSFWEGVDVVGDALRCVIIVKLPFKVPSEPLIQARSEAITAKGGDPFMEYSLPQAIVKFKQGFGRLIRNKRDRGCIVCLDNRITTKRYGKLFLNSLPNCQQVFGPTDHLQQLMMEFYRKTHYLTQS